MIIKQRDDTFWQHLLTIISKDRTKYQGTEYGNKIVLWRYENWVGFPVFNLYFNEQGYLEKINTIENRASKLSGILLCLILVPFGLFATIFSNRFIVQIVGLLFLLTLAFIIFFSRGYIESEHNFLKDKLLETLDIEEVSKKPKVYSNSKFLVASRIFIWPISVFLIAISIYIALETKKIGYPILVGGIALTYIVSDFLILFNKR